MIRIHWTKNQSELRELKITGHAESAPYGMDLVCAGVSAIALSSLNAIDELYPHTCAMRADHNAVRIQVENSSLALQNVLAFLEKQLACMQEQYPEFVRITVSSKS